MTMPDLQTQLEQVRVALDHATELMQRLDKSLEAIRKLQKAS